MAAVRVICGVGRSLRTRVLDDLARSHWDHAALVVPTEPYAQRRAEQVILDGRLRGCMGRPVMTFRALAQQLLQSEGVYARELDGLQRSMLMRRAIQEVGERGALDALGAVAKTAGFAGHMVEVVTRLKQAAVEPPLFRQRIGKRKRKSWLDDAVADVYETYQDLLRTAGLYDRVGLYWESAVRCGKRPPAALEGINMLLFDGFDDFTPSEFRLIEALEQHVGHLVFGFACETEAPSAADLYAASLRTVESVLRRFNTKVEQLEAAAPRTFVEFAAKELFWRDRPRLPEGLAPNLEWVACRGIIHEVETIGRRVKALLVEDNVPPECICVVYRDLGAAGGVIRAVFGEFGIPIVVKTAPRLEESSLCAFIRTFFDAIQDWQRETVLDVLTSPWFAPATGAPASFRAAAPALARAATVFSGYDEWVTRLRELRDRVEKKTDEDAGDRRGRIPEAEAATDALLADLAVIKTAADRFESEMTPSAFAGAVECLLQEMRIDQTVSDISPGPAADLETGARKALRKLWGSLRAGERGAATAAMPLTELVMLLRDAFGQTPCDVSEPACGVLCTDALSARHLRFDHVFFGGVNEGEVPRPSSINAVYSDDDLADLAQAGVALESRPLQEERERLLFHHVIETARDRLYITWRTQARDGREMSPSPFIAELKELFGDKAPIVALIEAPVPPKAEDVACVRDLSNVFFAKVGGDGVNGRTGGGKWVSECREILAGVSALAAVEQRRNARAWFDRFDGVLSETDVIRSVGDAFAGDHVFSAQQLESYAYCPFRFFVEWVLQLSPEDEPAREFDPRTRGAMLHEALQRFHEGFRGQAVADIPEEDASEAMREAVESVFSEKASCLSVLPGALVEVERLRMHTVLERYLRIERDNGETDWKPSHFEVSFGQTRGRSEDPLNRPAPYRLATGDGVALLAGKIDRVDRRGGDARIVDYKTSVRVNQKDIAAGTSLQLPLYALALEEYLLPGVQCLEAWYTAVGRNRRVEAMKRPKEWEQRAATVREKVAGYIEGIRAGRFPPIPYERACEYCGGRGICRYDAARIERKEAAAQ